MKTVIVPFFMPHRGCPHACVFCNQQAFTGQEEGVPGPELIRETIAAYHRSASVAQVEVAFYGGTFTAIPPEEQRQVLMPLQPFLKSGQVSSIRVSTRPDALTPAAVALLTELRVSIVELGAQSMEDRVLQLAGRGHTAADTVHATALLQEAGMQVGVQLMPGLPGGTPEEAVDSLERALALGPAFLRIYPTVVVAGTRLAELYAAGAYRPWDLDTAVTCSARMLQRAARAGVPVIRVGVQPTDDLADSGAVLAGPFHPALRQLAESERWYGLLLRSCRNLAPGTEVVLACAPPRLSDLIGHCRRNLVRLADERHIRVTAAQGDPALGATVLRLVTGGEVVQADLLWDLDW